MYSDLVKELWEEIKRFITPHDREEVAETIVSTLVNYDENVDDIKDAFKNDPDIKRALSNYLDHEDQEEYVDEEFLEDDEDY